VIELRGANPRREREAIEETAPFIGTSAGTIYNMNSTFFHFTSRWHLRGIAKYGLTVGDVPTDINKNEGKIGVWLSTAQTAANNGLEGSSADKMRFCLSVLLPDGSPLLHKWTDWARDNCTLATVEALQRTAASFDSWYIYFGVIKPEAIVACRDMKSGEDVPDWATLPQTASDTPGVPAWRRHAWHSALLKNVARRLRRNHSL
jgi:hypothetical protein